LLLPGKKPVGNVKIDTNHNLFESYHLLNPPYYHYYNGNVVAPSATNSLTSEAGYTIFNGTDSRIYYNSGMPYINDSDFTVLLHYRRHTDHFGYIFSQTYNIASQAKAIIGVYHTSAAAGAVIFVTRDNSSNTVTLESDWDSPANIWRTIVARRAGTEIALFDKGGKKTTTGEQDTTSINTYSIGSRLYQSAWGAPFDGDIRLCAYTVEALPDSLCHSLVRDPYQFLIPAGLGG
jgi:hypothetical protein